jgi:ABC-2 type transport system ATP-binding protein
VTAPAIVVENLVKIYGTRTAVDGVSFAVHAGEVYGLLGPNGAGKSTTVEIIEGHRERTAGDVSVLGFDPARAARELRDRVGIVLQSSKFEGKLTVRETLRLYRSPYRRARSADECIEMAGLGAAADQRVETLSGGQQRRLDLAVGIVGYPEVLFLDEPTTGFDPAARRGAWELVRTLCSTGTTVLLTSHYLDEVEALADRVGVIADGRLVAEGTPGELVSATGATVVRFGLPPGVTAGDVAGVVATTVSVGADGRAELTTDTPTATVHALTAWAVAQGIELEALAVSPPSLEDTFLRLVGDEAAVDG